MSESNIKIEETVVQKENLLKEMFVEYVGNKLQPEDGQVTVEMCVEVLADEFPDFLLLIAQENFIRGYKQCITDMESQNGEQQKSE